MTSFARLPRANGADFRYRAYGMRLVDTFGVLRTGATASMSPAETRALALAEYATAWCELASSGCPSLPLSDDGQTASMLRAGVYLLAAARR